MIDAQQIETVLAEPGCARRRLSLEEVISVGLPAVYQGFGEQLLYMDGTIYDASDPRSLAEVLLGVVCEPHGAVCLEFGWRHTVDCSCLFCSKPSADEAA